jgi:hypothetical protein
MSSGRWERRGEGANGREERVPERVPGLYSEEVGVVYGAPCRKRLALAGGALGRHCALGPGVCLVSSVAAWFGRSTGSFSRATVSFRLGSDACVLEGAGRRWHRVVGTLPCRCWCRARLGGVLVHRNAQRTLRVLGGMVASGWRGRCAMYSGSEVTASRGIGRACAGELDGEVTGREVVGAALPVAGRPRWLRRRLGRRGVAMHGLCKAGPG